MNPLDDELDAQDRLLLERLWDAYNVAKSTTNAWLESLCREGPSGATRVLDEQRVAAEAKRVHLLRESSAALWHKHRGQDERPREVSPEPSPPSS